jgi:hypothetical protein
MTLLSVAQMNSQNDIEDNFIVIERLLQQSKAQAANLIVFLKISFVLPQVNNEKLLLSLKQSNNV